MEVPISNAHDELNPVRPPSNNVFGDLLFEASFQASADVARDSRSIISAIGAAADNLEMAAREMKSSLDRAAATEDSGSAPRDETLPDNQPAPVSGSGVSAENVSSVDMPGEANAPHATGNSTLPTDAHMNETRTPEPSGLSPEIHENALKWFKDLLRINTSNPPGIERPAIEYIARVFEAHNIPYRILAREDGRPNIFAELKPNDRPAILLSSHVDVVPVEEPARWKHDPFGAIEAEGMVWGRGALDMKYKTAFDLAYFVHASKQNLERPLKFIALADEEAGCEAGSGFLTREHLDLIKAEYVFNEVGGFNVRLGGKSFLPLQAGEKTFCHLRLHASGESMHGSQPYSSSAVLVLARAITAIQDHFETYHLCGASRKFFETLAANQTIPEMAGLFQGLLNKEMHSALLPHIPDPALRTQIKGMLCHTLTPTMLEGGIKVNVTPQKTVVDFDCRLIPGLDERQFMEKLQAIIDSQPECKGRLVPEVVNYVSGYELDPADPMLETIRSGIQEYWSENFESAVAVPMLLPASSDNAVYFRAGIKPIGFAPLKFPDDFPGFALIHADNERVPLEAFRGGLECYFSVLNKLLLQKTPGV